MSEPAGTVRLRLYVRGQDHESAKAEALLRQLCGDNGEASLELEIIDVLTDPEQARRDAIRITPTLIRHDPPPLRRIVGDLNDPRKVLLGLDLDAYRLRRQRDESP